MGSRNVDAEIGVGNREKTARENNGGGAVNGGGARNNRTHQAAAALCLCPPAPDYFSSFFKLLFFLHLAVLAVLVSFLSISGFLAQRRSFHPALWFCPLLVSAAASVLVAFLWLLFVLYRPRETIKASLYLAPLLTFSTAILLLSDGTGYSVAFGVAKLLLAVALSLYACWITPRLPHARQVMSDSLAAVRPSLALFKYVAAVLLASFIYFSLWTLGAGGVAASRFGRLSALYVILLLLSLVWTMQVMKCVMYMATGRLAYVKLSYGQDADARDAFSAAAGAPLLGHACYAAAAVPTAVVIWGMARALELMAGDTDEFMFSCTNCYVKLGDRVLAHANRWGLVYVGAYGDGLVRASAEVWGMFQKHEMVKLIDLDITGALCFLCGTTGGAVSALVAGSWVLAVDKDHVAAITVYAFFIGYFMSRIAMAWPQACVGAYHVVHAENPLSPPQGSCIPDRIRELRYSSD